MKRRNTAVLHDIRENQKAARAKAKLVEKACEKTGDMHSFLKLVQFYEEALGWAIERLERIDNEDEANEALMLDEPYDQEEGCDVPYDSDDM